jgi:hypothetical protein
MIARELHGDQYINHHQQMLLLTILWLLEEGLQAPQAAVVAAV